MTTEEKLTQVAANLDRLAQVVNTLAGTVTAHDDQIEELIAAIMSVAQQGAAADQRLNARIEALAEVVEKQGQQIAATERQWQAYINR